MFKVLLGIFAALLFTAAAQAQSSYRIKSGDTLNVEVLEDSTFNRSALVLPDGTINFPLAGSIAAGGRTVGQVQSDLKNALSSTFASPPTVFVSVDTVGTRPAAAITAPASKDVYVTGEIANPGKLATTRRTTILQAIAQAGGLTRFAADKRIQLRRGDHIYLYNYRTNRGGLSGNTILAPGDVIVVPQRRLFE